MVSYDELFALRVTLQDEYTDEADIIRQLKSYLLQSLSLEEIDQYLHEFYNSFGINIPIEELRDIKLDRRFIRRIQRNNLSSVSNIINNISNSQINNVGDLSFNSHQTEQTEQTDQTEQNEQNSNNVTSNQNNNFSDDQHDQILDDVLDDMIDHEDNMDDDDDDDEVESEEDYYNSNSIPYLPNFEMNFNTSDNINDINNIQDFYNLSNNPNLAYQMHQQIQNVNNIFRNIQNQYQNLSQQSSNLNINQQNLSLPHGLQNLNNNNQNQGMIHNVNQNIQENSEDSSEENNTEINTENNTESNIDYVNVPNNNNNNYDDIYNTDMSREYHQGVNREYQNLSRRFSQDIFDPLRSLVTRDNNSVDLNENTDVSENHNYEETSTNRRRRLNIGQLPSSRSRRRNTLSQSQIFSQLINAAILPQQMSGMFSNIPMNSYNPVHMEDVRVTLQDDELESIRTIKFSEINDPKIDEKKCTICMTKFEDDDQISILKCNHIFHEECIKEWLKDYSYKCPVCRNETGTAKYDL